MQKNCGQVRFPSCRQEKVNVSSPQCPSGGMVDAADSKSAGSNTVRVRVSPWAPIFRKNDLYPVCPCVRDGTVGGMCSPGYEYLGKMKLRAAASLQNPAGSAAAIRSCDWVIVYICGGFPGNCDLRW